ncbi:hypothetical protein PFISCL1PPCAC_23986, partial [Pristionchus fissidentatus]
ISLQDMPIPPVDKFCSGKVDGFYGHGCETFFYSCQNGFSYKMTCPTGLYYDVDHKMCDRKEEIIACGAAPATKAPVPKAADVPVVPVENFCAGKTDGFYAEGCMSFFYSCQSGATYKMTCPSGLYYDIAKKTCELKEEIAACGAAPPATQAPAPIKAADVPVVLVENFCAGKIDGFYGAACQNFFYSCQTESTYKMTCTEGLFFDIESKQCDYRENIVACGGKKIEVIAPTASPALDRPVSTENFCFGKIDGFYGVGCSSFFYSCQEGSTYKMSCPAGLYYDITRKACDRKDEIAVCGAQTVPVIPLAPVLPPVTPAPVTAAPVAPSRDLPVTPLITPENFCGAKVDGFYGNGCASHFFSCQNGNTYKMNCPAGLFYDDSSKACDRRGEIVACGGARPQSPVVPSVPYTAPVAPSRDVPVAPLVPQENFCGGKADGFYGHGCSNYFFSCQNGATHKMMCPSGLFYDAPAKSCDRREEIAECVRSQTPVAPVAPVAPIAAAPSSSYSRVPLVQPATAAPVRDIPVAPVDDATFCFGKVDGVYSNGCEAFFFNCQNGETYKMACPSGLFYDDSTRQCDRRENIVACGGVSQPVISPITSLPVRDVPTVIPVTPVPVKHSEKFCTGKADGEHSAGCNNFYYSCQNEYTYKMACPAGLFYDASNKRCDMRENIVTCGGNPT